MRPDRDHAIEVLVGLYRQADGSDQPLTTIEHMPALEEKPLMTEAADVSLKKNSTRRVRALVVGRKPRLNA